MQVDVYFLPQLVEPERFAGGLALVIDVLRATTTMTAALAAGARGVVPCLEIEDALTAAASLPTGTAMLGGERAGVRIENFDLGNSPSDYTPAVIRGRTLVFTTTNGTRALLHVRKADEIALAAFVNLSAVLAACGRRERIHILCSGTGGQITREDVLLAGAIVARLSLRATFDQNDQATIAAAAWREATGDGLADGPAMTVDTLRLRLAQTLRQTQGGRNLQRLGLTADIDDAADIDRFAIVPKFDRIAGRIS